MCHLCGTDVPEDRCLRRILTGGKRAMLKGWLQEIQRSPEHALEHLVEIAKELAISTSLDGTATVEVQCALRHLRSAQLSQQMRKQRG